MIARTRRERLHEIIFEADTPVGRAFDVGLLVAIVLSVAAVMLESVDTIRAVYGRELILVEWIFTLLFTVEYALRLACVREPLRFASSFYGIIDLLAIVPTYLSIFVPGSQSLLVIRTLRLLRVFRVLKLARFVGEEAVLRAAVRGSMRKILVFLGAVFTLIVIVGTLMYLIEGREGGFTSIPQSVYWAVVTVTTVGYGDIAPQTVLGKLVASLLMVTGYGIIAVPTGIVTVELANVRNTRVSTQACPNCGAERHDHGASYCNRCGAHL